MHNFKILHLIAKIDREIEKGLQWMLLFKAGTGEIKNEGHFLVDKQAFDLMQEYVGAQGNEIVFDYEHQTVKGTQAPAAGWIKELAWEDGVGIKARVEWTDKALEYIANGEYRYFSPVFFTRKIDRRVCGLHSVALTNTPKTKNLTPILAKLELEETLNKEEVMDKKKLIADLGLKDDATDKDIAAAVAKLGVKFPESKTKTVISKDILDVLELEESDDETAVVASINVLKQTTKNSVSVEDFNKLQAKIAKKEAGDVVDAAMKAGKITPDQKEWATDYAQKNLKGFELFISKAPVVIPLSNLPGKEIEVDLVILDKATKTIANMMDVTADDIKKYGGDQ